MLAAARQPSPSTWQPRDDSERLLAQQCIRLASRFHASEYCRARFGDHGSSVAYVPLSIHLPDSFQALQDRLARHAHDDSWFLHDSDSAAPGPSLAPPPVATTTTTTSSSTSVNVVASPTLQSDISAAIDTPLGPPPPVRPPLQTSATHPLHVSPIVPPELLTTLSLHLAVAPADDPTLFTVHPAFSLERITSPAPPPVPSPPPHSAPSQARPPKAASLQQWNRSLLKTALSNALASSIRRSVPPQRGHTVPQHPHLPPLAIDDTDFLAEFLARIGTVDDLVKVPRARTAHERTFSAPPAVFKALLTPPTWSVRTRSSKPPPVPPAPTPSPPTLGNLFLSSCPGKKVRLDGAVHSRTSVNRDLNADMARIAALGVRCIVCCLDDAELAMLGAPWPTYSAAARAAQLDVLRIPLPEGIAPREPAQFDRVLGELLDRYSLCGAHVLVHCRGGVGRAGLVACCWMLRLGLCGWLPPVSKSQSQVPRDTLKLVERVIGVVRRQRSLKAVETYEQVRFLVEYVEYLRAL